MVIAINNGLSIDSNGFAKLSKTAATVRQVGSLEVHLSEIGTAEVRAREIGLLEIGSGEIAIGAICMGEIHPVHVCEGYLSLGQMSAPQLGT